MICWDRRLILATQRNARAASSYEKGVLEGGWEKSFLAVDLKRAKCQRTGGLFNHRINERHHEPTRAS